MRPRWIPWLLPLALLGCSGPSAPRRVADGLDASTLPSEVRGDYDMFARRCSKCHSLARPLNSGIDDDAFWVHYVARMRVQPASGITTEDEVVILRFLRYFAADLRQRKRDAEHDGGIPEPTTEPAP